MLCHKSPECPDVELGVETCPVGAMPDRAGVNTSGTGIGVPGEHLVFLANCDHAIHQKGTSV